MTIRLFVSGDSPFLVFLMLLIEIPDRSTASLNSVIISRRDLFNRLYDDDTAADGEDGDEDFLETEEEGGDLVVVISSFSFVVDVVGVTTLFPSTSVLSLSSLCFLFLVPATPLAIDDNNSSSLGKPRVNLERREEIVVVLLLVVVFAVVTG